VIGVRGILMDITETKDAELALEESEIKYQEIFNTTSEGIFIHDAKTSAILDVNKAVVDIYGYSHEEIVKMKVHDLSAGVHPYTQREASMFIRKAITEGTQVFEWLSKKKNGDLFWNEVTLQSSEIRGQGRVLAVIRDITDRKKAEAVLLESEDKFRNLAEQSPNMIFINKMGPIVYVNEMCLDVTGYTKEEICSPKFDFMTLIASEYKDTIKANFQINISERNHS